MSPTNCIHVELFDKSKATRGSGDSGPIYTSAPGVLPGVYLYSVFTDNLYVKVFGETLSDQPFIQPPFALIRHRPLPCPLF